LKHSPSNSFTIIIEATFKISCVIYSVFKVPDRRKWLFLLWFSDGLRGVILNVIRGIKDYKNYVLYFGRFSEEKGIKTLISVCRELQDVQFIFAGTGPLEDEMKGVKNINNVGFQTGDALEKLIIEARFSIYPSEWYENCPFSVMESQMYGTPVLGADIGGIPELITVGKTGELFESGNKNELKKQIQKLWEDMALTDAYSNNCMYISFDTVEQYYQKIMRIYGS